MHTYYINLLKTDISVFKHHLKINNDIECEEDIVYKEKLDKPINNTNGGFHDGQIYC